MLKAAMQRTDNCDPHGCAFETSPFINCGEVSIADVNPHKADTTPFSKTGTHHAINYFSISDAANLGKGKGRGGARNFANRLSYGLSKSQVANLTAADHHAAVIGLPFNRMVSIHWKAAGVALNGIAKATGSFIDKLTKWLSRRNYKTAWLWVHENTGDKCWHCHILIHIPVPLVAKLPALQKRWLKQITAQPYRKNVIHSAPIGGRLGLEENNPELHFQNRMKALAYVLKGATSALPDLGPPIPQGIIFGRRCSTSQNIACKARNRRVT